MVQKSQTTTWDVFDTLYIMGFQLPFPQLVIAGFLNHQQYVMQNLKKKLFNSTEPKTRLVSCCFVAGWNYIWMINVFIAWESNCLTIIGLSVFRGQKAENLELVDVFFFGRANTQVITQ